MDENEVYEECPICEGSGAAEATIDGLPIACAWCNGTGLVVHDCEAVVRIFDE